MKPVMHQFLIPRAGLTRFLKYNPVLRRLAQFPTQVVVFTPYLVRPQSTMSDIGSNPSVSSREMFSYTSGRYLYNEKLRLAERYVEFNIEALQKIAAQSVHRERVVHMGNLRRAASTG